MFGLTGFDIVDETSSDDEDVVSFESFLTDIGVLGFGFGVVAEVEGDRGFEDVVDEFC
jgi:hypothetical protein